MNGQVPANGQVPSVTCGSEPRFAHTWTCHHERGLARPRIEKLLREDRGDPDTAVFSAQHNNIHICVTCAYHWPATDIFVGVLTFKPWRDKTAGYKKAFSSHLVVMLMSYQRTTFLFSSLSWNPFFGRAQHMTRENAPRRLRDAFTNREELYRQNVHQSSIFVGRENWSHSDLNESSVALNVISTVAFRRRNDAH